MTARPSTSAEGATPAPLRELRGVVERITYQNAENGYTVARLAPERPEAEAEAARGDDRLVTVVGTLADLTPGEAIVAHGWWRNDPKHGWQFQAVDYRTALPATLQGMKKYLGSGLVKGIGPVNAGRIVDAFGEATFEVIDDDPQRLTEVPGIGPVRAGRIAATWAEQRHIREVMAALQGYGISTSLAVRIYKKFGDDSGTGHRRGAVPPGPRGLGHRLQDRRQDRPGRRHRAGRARAAPGRACCTRSGQAADEGHTLLPEADLRRAGGRRCSGPSARPVDAAVDGAARRPATLVAAHAGRATSRAARAGAVRAGRVRAWPPACRRSRPRRPRRASGAIFGGGRLGGGLRLAGRAPRPDARARAGGGGADGADLAGLDPDRRAGHGQDPHAARRS